MEIEGGIFTDKNFLARGYFVSTVGLDEEMVKAYIRNQEASVDTTGYYIGAWFVPADTALWEWSWMTNINGQTTSNTWPVLLPNDETPWRREQFDELYWNDLFKPGSNTITDCKDDPDVSCNIVMTVSRLDSNYDISGNGEVGTLIYRFGWL